MAGFVGLNDGGPAGEDGDVRDCDVDDADGVGGWRAATLCGEVDFNLHDG